jgi:hypothetical protein
MTGLTGSLLILSGVLFAAGHRLQSETPRPVVAALRGA